MVLSEIGEKELIRRIAGKIQVDRRVVVGIGDDCAVLRGPRGKHWLLASDMLVERVHFLRRAQPEKIGWKALAVNVSDVAAMGGVPHSAVVSLGLPQNLSVAFVDRLYAGLRRCARAFGVNLVGGDTNRSAMLVVDVAILGEVEANRLVLRSGAQVGDHLLVTGRLGGSGEKNRHFDFTPRVKEARALGAVAKIHAMIDLSDGLGPDLVRICEASRVAAVIDAPAIPRRAGVSVKQALTDGEDFELLMAVRPSDAERMLAWAKRHLRCGLTPIGQVVARTRRSGIVQIRGAAPRELPTLLTGFRHF